MEIRVYGKIEKDLVMSAIKNAFSYFSPEVRFMGGEEEVFIDFFPYKSRDQSEFNFDSIVRRICEVLGEEITCLVHPSVFKYNGRRIYGGFDTPYKRQYRP